jgi:hypothetical protein
LNQSQSGQKIRPVKLRDVLQQLKDSFSLNYYTFTEKSNQLPHSAQKQDELCSLQDILKRGKDYLDKFITTVYDFLPVQELISKFEGLSYCESNLLWSFSNQNEQELFIMKSRVFIYPQKIDFRMRKSHGGLY